MLSGTADELKDLFSFDSNNTEEEILKKFKLFSRRFFIRYFKAKDAPFHDDLVRDYIKSYRSQQNSLDAAFRGAAKTSILKLFIAFVLQNDRDVLHKYIRVLSKDLKNSKQIVTDVYNMLVETKRVYGDQFVKRGDEKREETMLSFTMTKGVKLSAGSVGQDQRGLLQDEARPSLIIFEDVEDRGSVSSQADTINIIEKCQEALDGRSKDGSFIVNCNYISEDGVIQWFMDKPSVKSRIIPIATSIVLEDNEIVSCKSAWPGYFETVDINAIYKDAEDWYGEYLCNPSHSQNKFFNVERIEKDLERCIEPKRKIGNVKYWGDYVSNHRYGQGSDHSEGVGLDSNALALFDFNTGELIATHADNLMSPDLAATEYARVGNEFGGCLYAPEVNNKCGGIVITTLKDLKYSRIYRYIQEDKAGKVRTNKLGWETNGKTKNTMFMDFRRDYNDGLIIIYDADVLREMKAYSNSDLSETGTRLITRHFDLLTAVVIAWQMKNYADVGSDLDDYYSKLAASTSGAHRA